MSSTKTLAGLSFAVAVALCACSRDQNASAPATSAPSAAKLTPAVAPVNTAVQLARCTDAAYLAAVRAFEAGDGDQAKRGWLALSDGLDANLLGARIRAGEGDAIGAVRAIEAARAAYPAQGRVFATAAEIYALAGKLESAEHEIRDGLVAAGPTPDLSRARGVLALCREGGARAGLEHLLEARKEEPALEYCNRPLAQAHVLLGNASLSGQNALEAAAHARAALIAMPGDRDARELLADALAAGGEFKTAIETYEGLLAELRDNGAKVDAARARVETTLSWVELRGATAALLAHDRPLAIERYLRARELGVPPSELGFGQNVLAEEASQHVEQGLDAYDKADLSAARDAFSEALRLDPASLEAHNHLAVVLFKQNEFSAAAEHWTRVLQLARELKIPLPEPTHLNLARALYKAGRAGEVRALLTDYLRREPEGAWAEQTRDMLARLDAAPAGEQREQDPTSR
jgi:Tfp pilus assembly protein PilF